MTLALGAPVSFSEYDVALVSGVTSMTGFARIHEELKRRGVYRVGGFYAVAAWVMSEVAISMEEPLQLPGWLDTSIITVLAMGFPIVLILSYVFEITPGGVRRDQGPSAPAHGPEDTIGIPYILLSIILATIGFIVWQVFSSEEVALSDLSADIETGRITDVSQPVPGYDGRKAIAVLPFINMSGDADQGYLADGISEDIITELYSFQTFPVIARTSTFRYKGQAKDVRDIAAELGAGYVLEGSVRRIGDRVRITAQLIDAHGEHLWAEKYDIAWDQMLEVHDEITYSIVEAIEPQLISSEVERRRNVGTEDMVAWDYYLRARSLGAEEFAPTTLSGAAVTNETSDEAWRLANKALETAPDFAAVYALLSHIDGGRAMWLSQGRSSAEVKVLVERGLQNATRARALDPFESTACACQIVLLLLASDVEGAVQIGESALKENPGSAFILAGLAKAVQVSGDFERALMLIEKAKRLSPKGISMSTYLSFEALIRQSMGDMAGAKRVARQSMLLNGGQTVVNVIRIISLVAEGNREEAISEMESLYAQSPKYDPAIGAWPEPFPQAVIDRVGDSLRAKLQGKNYAQGVAIVLNDLGAPVVN